MNSFPYLPTGWSIPTAAHSKATGIPQLPHPSALPMGSWDQVEPSGDIGPPRPDEFGMQQLNQFSMGPLGFHMNMPQRMLGSSSPFGNTMGGLPLFMR